MKKIPALLMAIVMLVVCLYVPMSFDAFAENETVVYDFENTVTNVNDNKKEAEDNGVGYFGWGMTVSTVDGNKVLRGTSTAYWGERGGYRLHNGKDVCRLEPNSKYIVTMKVMVKSGVKFVTNMPAGARAEVKLGYGAAFDANLGGNGTNYVNKMAVELKTIVSSDVDSEFYNINTGFDTAQLEYSEDWQTVTYQINTPADFGSHDNALTIWMVKFSGIEVIIDDVAVTKLADNQSVVIAVDNYSSEQDIVYGEIGTEVVLPDISDRAKQADHIFEGWYLDENRTQSAEGVKFENSVKRVYSKWNAPVTYTFVNTLTGESETIDGQPGQTIEYPADPVDAQGEQWFMGWYTTEQYTEEYLSDTFGFASINLYSLWKNEIAELSQDFENYNKDEYTDYTNSDGRIMKSNVMYFAMMMSKQSEITYGGSANAIKFDWKSSMRKDPAVHYSYDASSRYNQMDMYVWLGKGLDDKTQYEVTFKYKVESTDANLNFYVASSLESNIWANGLFNMYSGLTVNKDAQTGEWQEGKFTFTTNYKSASADSMFFGIMLSKNTDTVVYFDDISIEAVAQPYESAVTVNTGFETYNIKGNRGGAVVLETPTNPDGADFKGWYLDEKFTVAFENGEFERKPYTVYAKWGIAPITFRNYQFYSTQDSHGFGKLMSIDKNGRGYDNDNALRFDFKGSYVYKVVDGETKYYYDRYKEYDHLAAIANPVENNTLYRITYKYKVLNANTDINITPVTGYYGNIWVAGTLNTYPAAKNTVKLGTASDWEEYTAYFTTDIKTSDTGAIGSALYLVFGVKDNSEENVADILVDNVIVEKVEDDIIFFDGNSVGATSAVVRGNVGDPITYPEVTNGKATFLGWYTDKDCTVPFTATTLPQGVTTVYAKWKAGPITFENYPFFATSDSQGMGKLVKIDDSGVGYDDAYAARFDYNGSYVYKVVNGETKYFNTRYQDNDHMVMISDRVKDKTVYRVTYKYKVVSANTGVTMTLFTGYYGNVWVANTGNKYAGTRNTVSVGDAKDWKEFTCYVSTDIKKGNGMVGDAMYLIFGVTSSAKEAFANVLVDDVFVEEIEPPYVMFEPNNSKPATFVNGAVGDTIKYPEEPKSFGKTFVGWYSDIECTVPFTAKTFTDGMAVTAYAGYKQSSTVVYDLEEYDLLSPQEMPGKYYMEDAKRVKDSTAYSGEYVMQFDRTGKYNTGASAFAVANGSEVFTLKKDKTYVVTITYRITKAIDATLWFHMQTALPTNMWAYGKQTSGLYINKATQKVGQWMTMSFVVNGSMIERDEGNGLFVIIKGGTGGIVQLDDVTVSTVDDGYGAVVISNGGCNTIPTVIIDKIGANYANKLPKNPEMKGMYFKGYYTMDSAGAYTEFDFEKAVIGETTTTIYARFFEYEVKQDFDNGFLEAAEASKGYTIFDFDYEVYDSLKEGNSKDNVTSGRYSLHRKGDSRYFENSVLLLLGNNLAEAERYTVTFNVKMGKHLHTDGAIKVVSGRSYQYAWSTTGDYYPVVALKDLADGEWHTVSYTFNSVEGFVSIQTPGYAELFIDDVVFHLVGEDTPLSTPIEYTEYVPHKRDAQGNITAIIDEEIDVDSIIDESILSSGKITVNYTMYIIIGVAVILVLAASLTVILIIKKKKIKKA
ncbi:MAG: InlB B-repeat-containing protein [Acutalibacteraceae bacterium]|nr:InlB B-repeat-containing protein [Acutalibacteraceae bacterium]